MTDSSIKSGSEMSPASPFAWKPPRWISLCATWLQALVIYTGTIAAVIGCVNLVDHFNAKLSFLGLILLPVCVFAAVVIHECGHWLAARAASMTVYFAWMGPLQLKPLRRGMRIRWLWPKSKIHGAVMAFPDPHRPIRGQLLLMSLGGPSANIFAGLVFGVMGVVWIFSPAGLPLICFAVLNLALAIGNMLPTEQHMASDGLTILRSLRVRDEKDIPELIFMRLNGMAIRGMTVDEMPQTEIAKLAGMAMPMPLIHLWYRIKRHQHSAEWEQAAALESQFDELVAELPDGWKPQLADFVANLRCELRFCRAMAGLPLEQPIDDGLTDELDWFSPTLRPRCQAMNAIREGNLDVARAHLAESERWALRSIDLALERSEANLRRAMLAELGRSA